MNFCLLCLLFFNKSVIIATLFYFFGHSLTTSFLFFVVGLLYEQTGTRNFLFYRGLFFFNGIYSFCFFLGCLGNVGFPSFVNFIGELFVFLSLISFSKFLCLFLCFILFFAGVNNF